MMSQNRQDTKDRLRGELDYDVNRRAESEIQGAGPQAQSAGKQGRRHRGPAERRAVGLAQPRQPRSDTTNEGVGRRARLWHAVERRQRAPDDVRRQRGVAELGRILLAVGQAPAEEVVKRLRLRRIRVVPVEQESRSGSRPGTHRRRRDRARRGACSPEARRRQAPLTSSAPKARQNFPRDSPDSATRSPARRANS